ncbi:protein of unknown function [Candidatus Methylomirabilis oxygeniifera]|uniref:Uncharacterized protein n=1 Tax=Methylomirabilis oxygeniifera TaxID=671143 RepID=D5MEQ8_METO1|nr:protein of unknown function [Candidatus Methylomirabilis oxyfera]
MLWRERVEREGFEADGLVLLSFKWLLHDQS